MLQQKSEDSEEDPLVRIFDRMVDRHCSLAHQMLQEQDSSPCSSESESESETKQPRRFQRGGSSSSAGNAADPAMVGKHKAWLREVRAAHTGR